MFSVLKNLKEYWNSPPSSSKLQKEAFDLLNRKKIY